MRLNEKSEFHFWQQSNIFWAKLKLKTELVNEMFNSFKFFGCNMSIKVHYLHSHLDHFPENIRDTSEEQGERFHKGMEEHYQGRSDMHTLANYCWSLKRDCCKMHSRMPRKRSFRSINLVVGEQFVSMTFFPPIYTKIIKRKDFYFCLSILILIL